MITLAADYFDQAFANPEWWLKQAELAGDQEEKVACRTIAARLRERRSALGATPSSGYKGA